MKEHCKLLICFICISILLAGCGAAQTAQEEAKTVTYADSQITIPAALVGDEALEDNIISVDDTTGDITYELTGSEISGIVDHIVTEIDDSIDTILADDEYYPDIKSIDHNDEYTEFTIKLKDGQANIYESMLSVSFYTIGNKYQIYNGISAKDALTTVEYTNASTGEVIASGDSSSLATN